MLPRLTNTHTCTYYHRMRSSKGMSLILLLIAMIAISSCITINNRFMNEHETSHATSRQTLMDKMKEAVKTQKTFTVSNVNIQQDVTARKYDLWQKGEGGFKPRKSSETCRTAAREIMDILGTRSIGHAEAITIPITVGHGNHGIYNCFQGDKNWFTLGKSN